MGRFPHLVRPGAGQPFQENQVTFWQRATVLRPPCQSPLTKTTGRPSGYAHVLERAEKGEHHLYSLKSDSKRGSGSCDGEVLGEKLLSEVEGYTGQNL